MTQKQFFLKAKNFFFQTKLLMQCICFLKWLLGFFRDYVLYVGYNIVFKRAGKCNQCGRCCRHVYLRDRGRLISSFDELLQMIKADQKLKRFISRGYNDHGELYFACDFVGRNNKCQDYKKRPALCHSYPSTTMLRYGAVPKDDCGFYFINRFTRKKLT